MASIPELSVQLSHKPELHYVVLLKGGPRWKLTHKTIAYIIIYHVPASKNAFFSKSRQKIHLNDIFNLRTMGTNTSM